MSEPLPPHERSAGFFAFLVSRPVLLSTLLLTCIVVGLIAWSRIPIQMMPDGIVEPGLEVYVVNQGASAQENEEKVARVLEEELRSLASVSEIDSTSSTDYVGLYVQFESTTDMNFAKAEVRDRVERARPKLPTTVEEIGIFSWSESDMPIMFFALKHPGDSPRTDFLVENVIRRRLEAVDGVGKVDVWGILDDSLRILLDEDRVRAARLDLGRVIQRLAADNFTLSMGEVEEGGRELLLRSDMRFKTPEEIEDYPIGDGLRIRDIGTVMFVKSVRESLFRIDGQYAYFVEIRKESQANVVETCRRLEGEMARLETDPALAGEFKFVPIFDQGLFIRASLKQLTDSAWEGGLLAVIVLFVFLWRVRQTVLVALAIPFSVLLAIAWCYFTGRSFNVLTMTGITLALGMLVDNAIVVMENIARLRLEGRPVRTAVIEGTSEVALAVTLSTLTGVVVFMPLIFMTENPILRILFGELGLPLCVSLLISLLAALIFLPVAAEFALRPRPAFLQRFAGRAARFGSGPAIALGAAASWCVHALRHLFTLLARATRIALAVVVPMRWVLVLALAGLCAWRIVEARPWMENLDALASQGIGTAMGFPLGGLWIALLGAAVAVGLLLLLWRLPAARKHFARVAPVGPRWTPRGRSMVGHLVDANHALVEWSLKKRFAASLITIGLLFSIFIPINNMEVAAFGEDDSRTQMRVYVDLEDNFTLAEASDEMARYEAFLEERRAAYALERIGCRFNRLGGSLRLFWENAQKKEHLDYVLADLQEHLPRVPGHRLRFIDDVSTGETRNKNLATFRIRGPDSEELLRLGTQAIHLLEAVPGLSSISSPLETAPQQVQLSFDSDVAQKLGVTPQDALENVAWALRGAQLPRFQEKDREVPLFIEYDETQAAGLDTLRELEVYTGTNSVPLASIADVEFGRGSRRIWRQNGKATFTIQARVENSARQHELEQAGYRALGALELPRGYSLGEEDSAANRQEEEFGELLAAFFLSFVLVFVIMAILFESLVMPFAVSATVPFAILGSYWGLYATGTPMDSIGWIGIIILIGVEVNHGIVLIDRVHQLRRRGMERTAAVLEGCSNRVRPIVMTALTAVLALLPMALTEPSGDSIDFRALATCVGSGLLVSTIFTLWVVPLAYTLLDDFWNALVEQVRWSLRKPSRDGSERLQGGWTSRERPDTASSVGVEPP